VEAIQSIADKFNEIIQKYYKMITQTETLIIIVIDEMMVMIMM